MIVGISPYARKHIPVSWPEARMPALAPPWLALIDPLPHRKGVQEVNLISYRRQDRYVTTKTALEVIYTQNGR